MRSAPSFAGSCRADRYLGELKMFAQLRKGALAAMLLAGAVMASPAFAADAKDIIYKGDAKCTSCHDENEAVPVLSIAKTKHGVAKDGRVPSNACLRASPASSRPVPRPTHSASGRPVRQCVSSEAAAVLPIPISPKPTTLQPCAARPRTMAAPRSIAVAHCSRLIADCSR